MYIQYLTKINDQAITAKEMVYGFSNHMGIFSKWQIPIKGKIVMNESSWICDKLEFFLNKPRKRNVEDAA